MVLTKALEAYGKYFKWIAVLVLPVGIMIGLILCGITIAQKTALDLLLAFNIPGWLFSPLWIGPLLYGLSLLESGQEFRYKTVIINGLRSWWKLLIVPVIVIGFKYIAAVGAQLSPGYGSLVWGVSLLMAAIIGIRYIFIFPVLTLEKHGLIQALRRCASLSKGRRLSLFFELTALGLLLYVAVFILTMVLGMAANFGGGIVSTFIYFIIIMGIISPLRYALIVVWIYYCYREQGSSAQLAEQGF